MEGPVHGAIRGDRVRRQPGAVDVAVEVVLGAHRRIGVLGVEDSCQQCIRHALTLGGEGPMAWDECPRGVSHPKLRDVHGV